MQGFVAAFEQDYYRAKELPAAQHYRNKKNEWPRWFEDRAHITGDVFIEKWADPDVERKIARVREDVIEHTKRLRMQEVLPKPPNTKADINLYNEFFDDLADIHARCKTFQADFGALRNVREEKVKYKVKYIVSAEAYKRDPKLRKHVEQTVDKYGKRFLPSTEKVVTRPLRA